MKAWFWLAVAFLAVVFVFVFFSIFPVHSDYWLCFPDDRGGLIQHYRVNWWTGRMVVTTRDVVVWEDEREVHVWRESTPSR